jgi:hypothetical protein
MYYYNIERKEKANRAKSMRISIAINSTLLLIAFFYYFKAEVKSTDPNKPYKIAVEVVDFKESSFSTKADADKGEKRIKTEDLALLAPTKPVEVIKDNKVIEIPKPTPIIEPTPPAPTTSTVLVDEGPVVAVESDIKVEDPSFEQVPDPKPVPKVETPTPPVVSEPVKNNDTKSGGGLSDLPSNTNGTNTKPAGTGGGDGDGKSDSGLGKGSTSGNDNTSGSGPKLDGTGKYDGSGRGIFGRKVTFWNTKAVPLNKNGKVSVKICIDVRGNVGFAEVIEDETTITDRATLKKVLSAAYGYKFQPDTSAPTEECGKLIFALSNFNASLAPKI